MSTASFQLQVGYRQLCRLWTCCNAAWLVQHYKTCWRRRSPVRDCQNSCCRPRQGMSERGFLPGAFNKRSRHGTPTLGIICSSVGVLAMARWAEVCAHQQRGCWLLALRCMWLTVVD